MMKLIEKKYLLFVLVTALLFSCQNQQIDDISIEEGRRKHEFIAFGKRISFVLPEYYVNTDTFNIIAAAYLSGCDYDTIHAFYSKQNNKNSFVILITPVDFKDSIPNSLLKDYLYDFVEAGLVPFFEKKHDENNHVFYLSSESKIEKNNDSNYIYSQFSYTTIFDKKYGCELTSYDLVDSFSYEEKRKIIESIKIEDIK